MTRWKIALIVAGALVLVLGVVRYSVYILVPQDIYIPMFAEHCGACHGAELKGTERGQALVGTFLEGGDTIAGLIQSIAEGNPDAGMPAFGDELSIEQIKGLAIYVAERRQGLVFVEYGMDREVVVPGDVIRSKDADFRVEPLAEGLAPLVFSIAPLPDGSLLLSDKKAGLFVVSADGKVSAPVEGTPKTTPLTLTARGLPLGIGFLLDVAIHPDYEKNGWVYLHYTHLCDDCRAPSSSILPVSMNRLERGRIRDGNWVDVETLWTADPDTYTFFPDTSAGGRIAFDDSGHVFFSIGLKSASDGAQDLDLPYGKIMRLNDDGSIPADNPFVVASETAAGSTTRSAIWTYGHRAPQGLEWNSERGRVWNSEMGPRGGDEINELLPGRNYGWPFHSLGLEYTGNRVHRQKQVNIEFDESDVEQTLVDITPSPGTSSFAFYHGSRFPGWRNNVLLGSLKGSSLFRYVFAGNRFVHKETLIADIARVRDVEVGFDGLVYLLLETSSGGHIVRLIPEPG